jgi:DnaJ-domain-containing protein 1
MPLERSFVKYRIQGRCTRDDAWRKAEKESVRTRIDADGKYLFKLLVEAGLSRETAYAEVSKSGLSVLDDKDDLAGRFGRMNMNDRRQTSDFDYKGHPVRHAQPRDTYREESYTPDGKGYRVRVQGPNGSYEKTTYYTSRSGQPDDYPPMPGRSRSGGHHRQGSSFPNIDDVFDNVFSGSFFSDSKFGSSRRTPDSFEQPDYYVRSARPGDHEREQRGSGRNHRSRRPTDDDEDDYFTRPRASRHQPRRGYASDDEEEPARPNQYEKLAKGPSLYDILGVRFSATPDEIKAAHRKLSMKWHPDKVPPEQKKLATKKMAEINRAYDVLKDPDARKSYDIHDGEIPKGY